MPGEGNFKHKNEAPGVKCVRMEVTAGHAGFVFVLVVLVHGFLLASTGTENKQDKNDFS